jgi:predicted MPP superfamily phosphohydrolase
MGIPWSRSEKLMREDVNDVVARRDPKAYPILLAHHPHAFDAAADARLPLTLSGHTHGGQLAINRDINAGNVLFRYVSGLYQHGDCKLLVSNGTGNWFPLRVGAPAEIIEITLTRA